MKNKYLILVANLIFCFLIFSQDFSISTSEYIVNGTSTLHDWHMKSEKSRGKLVIKRENGSIKSISSLSITIPANSLKSTKKGLDENAYKALKSTSFPLIEFDFLELISIKQLDNKEQIKIKGTLKIAGNKKTIPLDINVEMTQKTINFKGEFYLKFTDMKIDPPKALLGTVKTGNDLKIKFSVNFE